MMDSLGRIAPFVFVPIIPDVPEMVLATRKLASVNATLDIPLKTALS
jgi:hypothetical protein